MIRKARKVLCRRFFTSIFFAFILLVACKPGKPLPTVTSSVILLPTSTPIPTSSPTPTETLVPIGININLNPNDIRQTVRQIGGGNFNHYFGNTTTATEPVSKYNIETLHTKYARVSIELQEWEPVNDNADPYAMNQQAFRDDQHNRATFELMKLFKAEGVEITASIWRVPDWLVENPQDESPRTISNAMVPEAVESIAAWLLHARDQYGVDVDYVSFNEANLGVTVLLSPEEYIGMIREGGRRFAELGLTTKWLLGDCSSIKDCLGYVQPIWSIENIRPYIGPLAFHSWDGMDVSDETITALGEWAFSQGLDVRCTEAGWDAQLWQRPAEFSDWTNARQLAISYNRVLKMSRATAFYYWEMMGNDYALNNGVKAYPALQILQQMNDAFPAGTQILGSSTNNSSVYWVAGRKPSGDFILHIVSATLAEKARITGLPNGKYGLIISTRDEITRRSESFTVTDGSVLIDIPTLSVVLIETQH